MQEHWKRAWTFAEMRERARSHRELWGGIHDRARIPGDVLDRVFALAGRWRLLVLSEDWCGDAVNSVPVLARLADAAPNLELRILARDQNPELMDTHLTGTSRSIPIVIVLDETFREHGWWGPRPTELQQWFIQTGRDLPKDVRYREIRGWYARDRGASTLAEVVALLERAARGAQAKPRERDGRAPP